MSSETVIRRLAAIVSVDAVGYSRLVALDEVGTVRRLTEYREIIADLAKLHRGRVVDNPGDNALLEFPSPTDAVECSVEIQRNLATRNAELPADRRMDFRVGVHLGEVMVEADRIYGDGVNVAARLESIAPVGGLVVSKAVRDQVASKVDLRFEDMGEHGLKNIPEPVHYFQVGESTERAIVAASIANFTALLGDDAEGTLSVLKAHRTAADPLILSHGGRVVYAQQNRILYEFPSAVEAVECASEVQALMAGRNALLPEARRMRYRLGIHHGNDDEAVVVAAAIEQSADPGGMSLSDSVCRQVAPELHLSFKDGGRLSDGARVWKVAAPTAVRAEVAPTSGPGALLVLPFERLGNESSQDYLVDGITEDLITALSEYGELKVVPRSSSYAYRDSPLSDRDIARQLDANYVMKASVRATERRVRVSTELIEAESGSLIWSDRFDRDYDDILDLQDEISHSIATKLSVAARDEEVRRSMNRTDSLESWDFLQRGKWHYYRATRDDFDRAIQLYEEAIRLDPDSGAPYSWLCLVLITRIWHGWSPDVAGDFERIRGLATEAVRLDPSDWRAHSATAVYYMFQTRDFDRALAEAEYGVSFEPGTMGAVYQRLGDHERSIELSMRDLQINPNRPDRYHWTTNLAQSHYMLGNYDAALVWAEKSLEVNPLYIQAVGFRAASLAQLGRHAEARVEIDRFMEHFSGMTAARYKKRFNFKNESDIDHYMDGLVKAGMPPGYEQPQVDQRAVWLAVLPFDNMSGDPDQEYFADGISEDVITGLSSYHSLRVIARSSSFQYRDSELSLPEIAERLDVQYLLEGSVRMAGTRVRVTAQLIEAPDSHHIWADRYDVELDDVFQAQDRITSSIVAAIDPAIRADHVSRPHPDDLGAWDHVQRGWHQMWKAKPDSNLEGADHLRQAIDIEPDYAEAHAGLGTGLAVRVWLLWSDDPEKDLELAEYHSKRAIELDERDALGHEALSMTAYAQGRMETTIKEGDRAIQLNPSRAVAYMLAGAGRIHGGDPEAGIPMMTKAMELSPQDPFNTWFIGGRAIGQLLAGHYEDAIVDATAAVATRYGYLFGRVMLIVAYLQLGRAAEARSEMATILEIEPEFSIDYLARYTFTAQQRDMFISSLRAAGLNS